MVPAEVLATGHTPIAPCHLVVYLKVALPDLASGTAVRIVAELGLLIHRRPLLNGILTSARNHIWKDARGTRFLCHQ